MAVSRARRAAAPASRRRGRSSGAGPAPRVASFAPQVGDGCRVLVLGTVPSLSSLAMRQSYAHPHNLFWPFMGELYGAGPELAYAERIARLHAAGVGIWDVLRHCERSGSLDSSILVESEVANDIPGLLDAYPTIRAVALNGGKAQQVFARRIQPCIDPARFASIEMLALPSTSPANASIPRGVKLDRWRVLLRWAPALAREGGS
ncbi:MAG TPA: DNA-deoxyinosine glycosylase [Rhodanobacteraceae bacterium]|nr:DNA-deoxyinosine glycosylase [Rhodanobacteraceae bacterium]